METKFQTSFIPKKPDISTTVSGPKAQYKGPINIFSTIASFIFVLTLFATGGAFAYKNILKNQIIEADKELNNARNVFNTKEIQELLDVSNRFESVNTLLEKHVVVSEVFLLLQTLTVKRVRFEGFSYTNKEGKAVLTMNTEGQSYNAIIEQSRSFSENGFIQDHTFSEFSLEDDGVVKMKFLATLLPELVSYKKVVEFSSLDQ